MGPLETRRALRTAVLGLLALGVVCLIAYIAQTAQTGLPFATKTPVKAAFHDVDALRTGDDVRQNSVRIGKVGDIEYVDGQAIVTLNLDGKKEVYADARAALLDFSALGAKFVNLSPGTPQAGPLGDRPIPADRNADSADIYQIYDIFDKKTLDASTSTLRQVGGGAAGHDQDFQDYLKSVPRLLDDLGTISGDLTSPEADLPELLRASRDISTRFANREKHITEAVAQSDATLRGFSVDNAQPLGDTLRKLPATLDNARAAFDDMNGPLADTSTFFSDFKPGAQSLSDSEKDLRGFLVESKDPLDKVPGVSDDAKPAFSDLGHTFSDARPLAPRVAEAFNDLATPLGVLEPYADEMGQLFVRGDSFCSENIDGLHYARLTVDPGVRSAAGLLLPNGVPQDHYPVPGTASHERNGLLGGHR